MTPGLHVTASESQAQRDFFLRLRAVAACAGINVEESKWATVAHLTRSLLGKQHAQKCDDGILRAALSGVRGTHPNLFGPELFGNLESPVNNYETYK